MPVSSVVDSREHVAHFYNSDDELISNVSAYVIEALESDETALMVTTASHMKAFDTAFIAAGIDLDRVRSEGRLMTFDAKEALHRFVVDDWPDADAFAAEMGVMVPSLIQAGRPLRVFGEMVGLLWDAGHVGAAIELENLWGGLLERFQFGLYCAYPANAPTGTHNRSEAVRQVCDGHTLVIGADTCVASLGGAEASQAFPWDLAAVTASRRFVTDTLIAWDLLPDVVEDAALIVSELATNAVMHARSPFTVLLSWEPGTLCISVLDASASMPSVKNPARSAISGRGLRVVSAMASRWGTDRAGRGKLVWAELPT